MKRWLIFSGLIVPLVVVGVLVFIITRTREPENNVVSTAKREAPAANATASLTQAANDEVKVGSDTYKILSAELDRDSEDKLAVRFMIRVTHMGEDYGMNVYESYFRLIADGMPRAPSDYPNEFIAPYSAKDVAVRFEIPDETKSIELHVGKVGEKTNKLVINMAALLNQSRPAIPEPPVRQYPVKLEAGAEAKVGDNTYRILSAELDRHSDGKMAVKFKIRMTNGAQDPINLYENSFRLIADGVPRAPEQAPNEIVAGGSSKDVDVLFVITETTAAIELQVGQIGKNTTRIPIDME